MSTFGGVIDEFPDIRVDYFRQIRMKPGQKVIPPALACFLSHVHSDHCEGLESLSFRGPFIYCSAATKELLLRLEKYPHRLNFARGILEAQKVHFKHLKNILKPIPLETPTRIELSPGNEIQVTLFDANHCTGAVMFLFEGNGKAVLYTGDIRSEPWMVNKISRNPLLIEYTAGLKTLDCIYLDTSNTADIPFPTKAAGLRELLSKVSKYPPDTVFHFEAWTFGYEEVWMALSKSLNSQIHVDRYKLKLYQSLRGDSNSQTNSEHPKRLSGPFLAHEGPVLTGYTCGNTPQSGCLTSDTDVRIHSCEKRMHCSVLNEKTIWIRPIITRRNGEDVPEIGVGGGGGDLNQHPDLVLNDDAAFDQLMGLFDSAEHDVKMDIKKMLSTGLGAAGRQVSLDGMSLDRDENELSLTQMAKIMTQSVAKKRRNSQKIETFNYNGEDLPRVITFPYSRHSSYEELLDLVGTFKPKDVYPCTVDEPRWVQDGVSIGDLFGHKCISNNFRHDREMDEMFPNRSQFASQRTQVTTSQSSQADMSSPVAPSPLKPAAGRQSISGPISRSYEIEQNLPVNNRISAGFHAIELHRNSEGRLRPFDAAGNEVSLGSEILGQITPPMRITAATPGAESQSLRRKAIFDELEGNPKRARLQTDRPDLSCWEASPNNEAGPSKKDEVILIADHFENPEGVNTPGSEADSTLSHDFDILQMYFDSDDQVHRCILCFSEIWGGVAGFCTGCENGAKEIPYYEDLEPNLSGQCRPGIVVDEYTDYEIEGEGRRAIVGDCLDDDSSAYDTQDSEDNFASEEYEKNSFIDDPASDAGDESVAGDASSSDCEEDWKARFQELQKSHAVLASSYRSLEFEFREYRMDMGDSFEEDDDEERDEDGMLIIGIPEPQVLTTELVISSSEELSDGSEISEGRIRLRAEAFEAVNGDSGLNWHDISLVSTTNNHTHEEIEL